jgi:dihydroorotate dehydrogenase
VYTAFIYRGWDVAGRINRELLGVLGGRSLSDLVPPSAVVSGA